MAFDEIYPLLTALTFAVSSVIIKRLEPYGSSIMLNMFRTLIGAAIFLFIAIVTGLLSEIKLLNWITILILIISVVTSVVIGDTLYFTSMQHVGVKIATPIVNLYPILSILIAIVFLDEQFNSQFILGSVITIVGIIILTSGNVELEEDLKDFKRLIKDKGVSKKTTVFNNMITTKSELAYDWEINIMDSWLGRFVK